MATNIKYSHTLIKNGEPFTKLILKQVEPFVDKMLVTISEKSDDNTLASLFDLKHEFPTKIEIDTENVSLPAYLTRERQKQLDKTPKGAWILFLDGDDYWPAQSLKDIDKYLTSDVDAISVCPFQVVTEKYRDAVWRNRWFTKWFRNDDGVHYRYPWPRDMIFKGEDMLYWRRNSRCPRIPDIIHFHLSNLMPWRFRDLPEFHEYQGKLGTLIPYDKGWEEELKKIFSYVRPNK